MGAPVLSIRSSVALGRALELLNAGLLIVVPTDTIYGIAAHPYRGDVISRLYAVRQRAPEPALPFLISSPDKIAALTRPTTGAVRLARRFWPGPLSLILPPAADLPPEFRTYPIAVRMPNFAPLLELLEMAGGYLITTGAMLPGYPPAITAGESSALLGDRISLILDGGPAPYGIPSTIVDCVSEPPVIVRRGIISEEKIRQALESGRGDSEGP